MLRTKQIQETFWITNITKKAVSLRDINVIIYPMRSINLLDKKHYHLTKEQVIASAEAGSLKEKSKPTIGFPFGLVVVRKVPPYIEINGKQIPIKEDAIFQTRQRSSVELENIKYEELDISDDDFATENADMAEIDRLNKYKK